MRINVYVAQATGLSRRAADKALSEDRVSLNGHVASPGDQVLQGDNITLDGRTLVITAEHRTIMLHKPAGYVCSRNGQGSPTIYELLPADYKNLKPVGRLDKDSSGLLLLTDDGQFANQLTHPRYGKSKIYEVSLDKPLSDAHQRAIEQGISLEDGPSSLKLKVLSNDRKQWQITMQEGRNRQIRRTFSALGYTVRVLHRTNFGEYRIGDLKKGCYRETEASP